MWWPIEKLVTFVLDIIEALFLMIVDSFCFTFELLMKLVEEALEGIFSNIDTTLFTDAIAAIPPGIMNAAIMLGIGEATAVVTGALTIRFVLQLIPLLRTGS